MNPSDHAGFLFPEVPEYALTDQLFGSMAGATFHVQKFMPQVLKLIALLAIAS